MALHTKRSIWIRWMLIVSPFFSIALLFHILSYNNQLPTIHFTKHGPKLVPSGCQSIAGMENVLVVLRTGVTKAMEKVPLFLYTSLRCVPNFIVLSDMEETISGVHIHDVLRSVNEDLKGNNSDFKLYNHARESGRSGLSPTELHPDNTNTPAGKPQNPGWALDKWKFLPMIDESLQLSPKSKWFVFIEGDTYMFWENLMAWLERFDASKPYYIGVQMGLGDITFGYGGAGFILSNPAMTKFSEYRSTRIDEMDKYTATQWAGDAVLGKLLSDAGIPLTFGLPMLQPETLWKADLLSSAWCFPVVSYHHVDGTEIEQFWNFDQQWHKKNPKSIMLHRDIFLEFIKPAISSSRSDWDNFSADEQPSSDKTCEEICHLDPQCLQYSEHSGKCFTSKDVKRGSAQSSSKSGWVMDRIEQRIREQGSCQDLKWIG